MTRDDKGNVGWSILALILGIIVIIPMIAREVWQSRTFGFRIEWNDIFRYGLLIGIFSVFHYFITDFALGLPWWWAL